MDDNLKVEQGVQTYKLDSWQQFHDLVATKFENTPAYIFRGQADAEWQIESTLDRLEKRFPTRPNFSGGTPDEFDCSPASRSTHLLAFQRAIRGRRGHNPPTLTENEIWALAQHHGMSTPMLDWTLSPFVALFFAFEEEKRIDKNGELTQPDERTVFSLSTSVVGEHSTATDPAPQPISPTTETSHRLLAQSGLFLKMPVKMDLESYVRKCFGVDSTAENEHARGVLKKIEIKNDDRSGCLKMLNKMNINRMTLFPDLDGACKYIDALWEIDFDTILGHLGDIDT